MTCLPFTAICDITVEVGAGVENERYLQGAIGYMLELRHKLVIEHQAWVLLGNGCGSEVQHLLGIRKVLGSIPATSVMDQLTTYGLLRCWCCFCLGGF